MAQKNNQRSLVFEFAILLALCLAILNLYYGADIMSRYLDAKSSHLTWFEQDKLLEDLTGHIITARKPGNDIYNTRKINDEKRNFLKAELALFDNTENLKARLKSDFSMESKTYKDYMLIHNKFIKANALAKKIFEHLLNGDEKSAYESKNLMNSLYGASINEIVKFKEVYRTHAHQQAMLDHKRAIDLMGVISSLMFFSIFVLGAIYFSFKKEISDLLKVISATSINDDAEDAMINE